MLTVVSIRWVTLIRRFSCSTSLSRLLQCLDSQPPSKQNFWLYLWLGPRGAHHMPLHRGPQQASYATARTWRKFVHSFACPILRAPWPLTRGSAPRGGRAGGAWGLSTPLLKVGELMYKIAPPHLLCPKNILQGHFWSHKKKYSIKKLVEG